MCGDAVTGTSRMPAELGVAGRMGAFHGKLPPVARPAGVTRAISLTDAYGAMTLALDDHGSVGTEVKGLVLESGVGTPFVGVRGMSQLEVECCRSRRTSFVAPKGGGCWPWSAKPCTDVIAGIKHREVAAVL